MKNDQGFIKKLCVIDFVLLLLVYISVMLSAPSHGYEISIYSMYHPIIWFIIALVVILSISIISLSEYWKIQGYWKIALFVLLLQYLILLLLPSIRLYYMMSRPFEDIFLHLAYIQHIMNMGTTNTIYPGAHVFLTSFQITGINIDTIILAIPSFFPILYILFLWILGRSIQRGPWTSLLPLLFAIPLLHTGFYTAYLPYAIAMFFLPLFFYLLFKDIKSCGKNEFKILLIVICFMLVYFHPLIAIILIILVTGLLLSSLPIDIPDINLFRWKSHLTYVAIILIISFSTWYLSFSSIQRNISLISEVLTSEGNAGPSIVEKKVQIIQGIDLLYILKLFVLNYGSIVFFLLMGFVCMLIGLNNVRMKKVIGIEVFFITLYFLSLLIAVAFLTIPLIVAEIFRALSIAILISIILIPLILSGVFSKISPNNYKLFLTIISLFLIIISINLIFTLYPSPIISSPSPQMTYMEKNGLDFFLNYRDDSIPILVNVWPQKKYDSYYYEQHINTQNKFMKTMPQYLFTDFSNYYDNYSNLSEMLDHREFYHISMESRRQSYLALPESRRNLSKKYISENLKRLNQDISLNLLYSNGEFESWIIPKGLPIAVSNPNFYKFI